MLRNVFAISEVPMFSSKKTDLSETQSSKVSRVYSCYTIFVFVEKK
jgi:hypothetical protein